MQISSDNILFQAQQQVCDILNADSLLSVVGFIPENSKQIEFEIKKRLSGQGICGIVMTPRATFVGRYEDQELAYDLDPLEVMITENCTVNRAKATSLTGQDAAMKVLDVLGFGGYGQFMPVGYDQGEDNGLLVNKVQLRCTVRPDLPINNA